MHSSVSGLIATANRVLFTLRREPFSPRSVKGELFIDEEYFCYTLERPEADSDVVAIPAGTYPVIISYSPHFGRNLPHIMDVPGRSAILMHGGNKPEDSLGCVLCGYQEFGEDSIGDAKAVNDLLGALVDAGGHGRIAVIDP